MKTEFIETLIQLKNQTGVGLLYCRNCLKEAGGDINKAIILLREKGILDGIGDDMPDVHREGILQVYTHGNIACMVEVNCQSLTVSKNKQFKAFAKRLCLHVVGYNPKFITSDEIPFSEIKLQEELYKKKYWKKTEEETKAEVKVRMEREYFPKMCLYFQEWIDDNSKTVTTILDEQSKIFGEKITVKRFVRWELH